MSSRFENRFKAVRQQSESPLAFSGVTPEILSELSMDDARSLIEALIRKRAQFTHSDVIEGREEESRSLSPYFKVLRDPKQAEAAIKTFIAEKQGQSEQLRSEIDKFESASLRELVFRQKISAVVTDTSPNCQKHDRLNPFIGLWDMVVLTPEAQDKLLSDPSAEQINLLSSQKPALSYNEIPVDQRDLLFIDALQSFEIEIEQERVDHAQQVMNEKYPRLAGIYDGTIKVAKSKLDDFEKQYEKLARAISAQAPLSDKLIRKVEEEVITIFNGSLSYGEPPLPALADHMDTIDLVIISQALQPLRVENSRIKSKIHNIHRSILGFLTLGEEGIRGTDREKIFTAASRGEGITAKEFLPLYQNLITSIPDGIINEGPINREPETQCWLITLSIGKDGHSAIRVEGQLYAAKPISTRLRDSSNQ